MYILSVLVGIPCNRILNLAEEQPREIFVVKFRREIPTHTTDTDFPSFITDLFLLENLDLSIELLITEVCSSIISAGTRIMYGKSWEPPLAKIVSC